MVPVGDLGEFFEAYPEMAEKPSRDGVFWLSGHLRFTAAAEGRPEVEDCFEVKVALPRILDREIPTVWEIGGRIPRIPDNHVNTDGSLCLGSDLRLQEIWRQNYSLLTFVNECLIPFLYGIALREMDHPFPFGELAHGRQGLKDDYLEIFDCRDEKTLRKFLNILTLRKRVGNKQLCPCDCRRILARCRYHRKALLIREKYPKHLLIQANVHTFGREKVGSKAKREWRASIRREIKVEIKASRPRWPPSKRAKEKR